MDNRKKYRSKTSRGKDANIELSNENEIDTLETYLSTRYNKKGR